MAAFIRDLDFYNLEQCLSPEERMTRDAVRRFVQREVLPSVERHFTNETFPLELAPMMAELGIFGANLKGYGCAGMNNIAYGLIMQELEAGDSGLRSFASVQSALAMYAIYSSGSEEQKIATCRRWPKANCSAASASPNPTMVLIRAGWKHGRVRTAADGC